MSWRPGLKKITHCYEIFSQIGFLFEVSLALRAQFLSFSEISKVFRSFLSFKRDIFIII